MGIDSTCPRDYFRAPEVCGARQGRPQEGHDVAMLYNTNTVLLESSKVSFLDSEQQRCLLSAVFICRDSGSRLVIGTTHLESGICDPADLRVMQLRDVLSRMDAYHLPCSIVAGDYNLRQWEAERAKVWELKKHLPSTLSMHSYSIIHIVSVIDYVYASELQGRLGRCLRDAVDTNHFPGVSSRG